MRSELTDNEWAAVELMLPQSERAVTSCRAKAHGGSALHLVHSGDMASRLGALRCAGE